MKVILDMNLSEKLQYMINRFMHEKMGYIIDLFQATYDGIMQDKEQEIVNWSERVIQKSHTLFSKEQLLNTQPDQ